MDKEPKKPMPDEYSVYLEAADKAEQNVTDTYAEAAKLKQVLADKKKEFDQMTRKNLENTLMGQAEAYPAAEILGRGEEIKGIEAKIADLDRLAEAGSVYAHNLVQMDKDMLKRLEEIGPNSPTN